MASINPTNERIKREYFRCLKYARGKSENTIDVTRKALTRYEEYTGFRDFKTFRRDQAIGFVNKLAETLGARSGERLSYATQASTLAALREFFTWLAWQPGYKSRIYGPDINYLSLSKKDAAKAKAPKLRDYPTLEQIRAVIAACPTETVIDRRDRALLALGILTGMRDRAIASLSLRHIDMNKTPPLVRQEPDRVETKFSKSIVTYFFPVGNDLTEIVRAWVAELRADPRFSMNSPVFPRTRVSQGEARSFTRDGVEPIHWSDASPIRRIYKEAFSRANLPCFPPHSFRHTLVHEMDSLHLTPEQLKAWSQNLGHEHVGTTLTNYGKVDPHRQGEVLRSISLTPGEYETTLAARIRAIIGG
jgi:integrase